MYETLPNPTIQLPKPTHGLHPTTLGDLLIQADLETTASQRKGLQPLATGFSPLDEVLNGGLRPGDLMVIGGAAGIGKTIFGLQIARNVALHHRDAAAMYLCYEHDEVHLLSRLLCLESAETGQGDDALTLARLAAFTPRIPGAPGLIARLRGDSLYGSIVERLDEYAERLFLVKANGRHTDLAQITECAWSLARCASGGVMVVDYLQKIPVSSSMLEPETEATTFLAQGLKDLAMETGLRIVAIAASDHEGLRRKRLRLADLRGSSALQYEADVGLILHNKYDIVSREHIVYNLGQAEAMRHVLVVSVEKNRSGRAHVDLEYALDASHFHLANRGGFVRERLVDERLTLE